MAFDPTIVAKYTIDDVNQWSWTDHDEGTFVGYIADEGEGLSIGLAFVRFRAGVSFDFTWPYDELSVVTKGSLTIRSGGERITARAGEILNQPRGVPGTFEIDEDMEMICFHYPTFARAQEMSLSEYKRHTDAGDAGDAGEEPPAARPPEAGGGFFDPTRMQRFGTNDIPTWIEVAEDPGSWVGYVADQAEGSPVGMAFSDFRAGGVHELSFPYDEVAAVTRGSFTVRSEGRTFTVGPGEMLYMPRDTSAVFEIDEDTVVVGFHYPTFQEQFGAPPHAS